MFLLYSVLYSEAIFEEFKVFGGEDWLEASHV